MTVKRLAVALLCIGALIPAAVLLHERGSDAQEAPALLRARAIELVDARGQVRAQLKVESSGEVVLRLRDEQGRIRAKLGADEDGSGLLLLNERTEPGVQILAKRTGTKLQLQRGAQRRVLRP